VVRPATAGRLFGGDPKRPDRRWRGLSWPRGFDVLTILRRDAGFMDGSGPLEI